MQGPRRQGGRCTWHTPLITEGSGQSPLTGAQSKTFPMGLDLLQDILGVHGHLGVTMRFYEGHMTKAGTHGAQVHPHPGKQQ